MTAILRLVSLVHLDPRKPTNCILNSANSEMALDAMMQILFYDNRLFHPYTKFV